MKKIVLITLGLMLMASVAQARFFDRFYVGGGVGMEFGSGNTNFEVQPLLGYYITQPWSAGVQLYYSYSNNDYYKQNGYGGGIFTRYDVFMPSVLSRILPAIHFDAEYDYITYSTRDKFNNTSSTAGYNMLPLGMGIYVGTGGRSRLSVTALWDMLHLSDSNGSPILRLSFIL